MADVVADALADAVHKPNTPGPLPIQWPVERPMECRWSGRYTPDTLADLGSAPLWIPLRGGGCVKSQKKSHAHLTRISRAISRRSRVHPAYIPRTSHVHPAYIPRTSPRKSVRIPGYPSCMYADPHYTAREIPSPPFMRGPANVCTGVA